MNKIPLSRMSQPSDEHERKENNIKHNNNNNGDNFIEFNFYELCF